MSIDASISKKWLVKNPDTLFKFLKDKEELLEKYFELRIFKDHLFLSKFGCECTSEENYQVSLDIYKQLDKVNSNVWDDIKKIIGCTNIIFELGNEKLFEF